MLLSNEMVLFLPNFLNFSSYVKVVLLYNSCKQRRRLKNVAEDDHALQGVVDRSRNAVEHPSASLGSERNFKQFCKTQFYLF